MKKRRLRVLIALCAVFALAGCGGGEREAAPDTALQRTDEETAEAETEATSAPVYAETTLLLPGDGGEVPVAEVELSYFDGCPLVRADECSKAFVASTALFRETLEKDCGMKVGIKADWLAPGEEVPAASREILIGASNRPESAYAAELKEDDYLIRWENDRLLIAGGSLSATEAAEEAFMSLFVDTESGKILLPLGEGYRYEMRYPCAALTLDGVALADYGAAKRLERLSGAVLSLTGRSMTGGSGRTVSFREDPEAGDLVCGAEWTEDGGILLTVGPEATPEDAASVFAAWLKRTGGFDPEKTGQTVVLERDALPVRLTEGDVSALIDPVTLYVSPDGDDGAEGSAERPLGTLNGARERVRELLAASSGGVTVLFAEGDYVMDGGVFFDGEDSGMPGAPVVYKAAPGAEVRFVGGKKIAPGDIVKAEGAAVLGRVNDEAARDALMQIDLSGYLDAIPDLYCYGHTAEGGQMPVEIYVGDTALTTARWPDAAGADAYVYTADKDVVTTAAGSKTIFYGDDIAERAASWSEESVKGLRMFGFLFAEWTNELYDASLMDREARSITLRGGLDHYFSSIGAHKRVYFCDLPEEITVPGECWIDRKNRVAYFYPPQGMDPDDVWVSALPEDMITLDGTRCLRFEGIRFLYTRGNAVNGKGAENIALSGCEAAHTSAKAFIFEGARNIRIENCEIFDTANGGISIRGGDRRTLTPSGCSVEGCEIHAVNRDGSTYGPGISAYGMGMVIRHNRLYDGNHEMIHVGSNDIVIEYNELFRCVKECSDMGAIYFGRNPTLMGTVIRYNWFHDMGNEYGGIGQFSVYLDDGNMGAEIYGNLFVRAAGYEIGNGGSQAAIMHHGVQFSHIWNNIFADTPVAFRFVDWRGKKGERQDGWYLWLYDRNPDRLHESVQKMREVDFDSALWREHYAGTIWENLYDYASSDRLPEMQELNDRQARKKAAERAPEFTNEMDGNLFVNIPRETSGGLPAMHDNARADESVFRDPAGGDWNLTEAGLALVRESCPDFEPLPFDEMGVQR